ncbi:MAG: HAD family hydrolase [Planctomycetota bacterium]
MKPAVFLDRDGTINREVHYLSSPEQFELLPGVGPSLRRLADAGFLLVVITNQSGIARGYFTEADLAAIHGRMDQDLAAFGVTIDRTYHSAGHPDDDDPDRKPRTGMIDKAVAALDIDRNASWVVGDKTVDILTGTNAAVRTILVKTGYGGSDGAHEVSPDAVAEDLAAAADVILERR